MITLMSWADDDGPDADCFEHLWAPEAHSGCPLLIGQLALSALHKSHFILFSTSRRVGDPPASCATLPIYNLSSAHQVEQLQLNITPKPFQQVRRYRVVDLADAIVYLVGHGMRAKLREILPDPPFCLFQ